MSHGYSPKFYKENLKVFLSLFRYQYTFPLLMGIGISALLVLLACLIPPLKPYRMDLLVSFGIVLGISIVLYIAGFLWRMFFLTSYTLAKWGGDVVEEGEEVFELDGHAYNHLIFKIALLTVVGIIGIFILRYFGIL